MTAHGRLLTVVDIGGFLTGRMTEVGRGSRVLALRDESVPAGFLVEDRDEWRLKVRGQIPFWPDVIEDFPFNVYPRRQG